MLNEHDSSMVRYSMQQAAAVYEEHAMELKRPFYMLKPKVFPDGDKWCALYGNNLQEGVCAFGDTPDKAAVQFDIEWLNGRALKTNESAGVFGKMGLKDPSLDSLTASPTPSSN